MPCLEAAAPCPQERRGADVGRSPEKLQTAERTLGSDSRVRTLAADMTKGSEIVVRRFFGEEHKCQVGRVACPTRKSSAEGEPHGRRQVRYAVWGACACRFMLSALSLSCVCCLRLLGFHHSARRRLTRLGLRAPVCHPEVDVCSPTTTGPAPLTLAWSTFDACTAFTARGTMWRSKLAMADRLAMDYCLAGALARALADGSHI